MKATRCALLALFLCLSYVDFANARMEEYALGQFERLTSGLNHFGSDSRNCEIEKKRGPGNRIVGVGALTAPDGHDFDVSVVSEEYAQELFAEMAAQPHIPFAFPEDGCYARAHEISRLLEKRGVITGKIFLEGNLRVETFNSPKGYVEWGYHVAPIVLVEKNGQHEIYVIDPAIFSKAVPVSEWIAIQTGHESGRQDALCNTERFNYSRWDKNVDLETYRQAEIEHMQSILEAYLRLQQARQQSN